MWKGHLVLISDENTPPFKRKHGFIVKTFAGSDNLVHVADDKISFGIFLRPIHKLCLLSILKNWTSTYVQSVYLVEVSV